MFKRSFYYSLPNNGKPIHIPADSLKAAEKIAGLIHPLVTEVVEGFPKQKISYPAQVMNHMC